MKSVLIKGRQAPNRKSVLITGRQTDSANRKAVVGAIQNIHTGKWWITITEQSSEVRFNEERDKVLSGRYGELYSKTEFRDDLETYGEESFVIVQLDVFDTRREAEAHGTLVRALWAALGYEFY